MSNISKIFGSPPPGIDLHENQTPKNNAAVIATLVVAVVSVVLRFFTKFQIRTLKLEVDDWLIIGSIIPLVGLFILTIEAGTFGLGKHVWACRTEDVVSMRKILFAYIYIYFVLMVMIKSSILMFYRRILRINTLVWVCLALCFAWATGCAIAFTSACRPPSYFWTMYLNPEGGKCVTNLYAYYLGNAAGNLFTDLTILVLPMHVIWRLQMRRIQKILASSIFSLGILYVYLKSCRQVDRLWSIFAIYLLFHSACIASFMRIYYMSFLDEDLDVNWIMGDVFVWSTIEPSIGILCACLPSLQPLLRLTPNSLKWALGLKSSSIPRDLPRGCPPNEGMHNTRELQQVTEYKPSSHNQSFEPHDKEALPNKDPAHANPTIFQGGRSEGNVINTALNTAKGGF